MLRTLKGCVILPPSTLSETLKALSLSALGVNIHKLKLGICLRQKLELMYISQTSTFVVRQKDG